MSIHRASLLKLFAWVATLCMAGSAGAQVRIPYENTLEGLQLFAPADRSCYDDKPYLKEGWFFNAEAVCWSVAKPERSVIGSPTATQAVFNVITLQNYPVPETSSLDTGALDNQIHSGHRIEFGQQLDCGFGWLVGGFQLAGREQNLAYGEAAVIFDDPGRINQGDFQPITTFDQGRQQFVTFDLDINGNGIYGRFGRDTGTFVTPFPGSPPVFVPNGQQILTQVTVFLPGPNGTVIPSTTTQLFTGFLDGIPEATVGTVTPFDLGDIIFSTLDFNDLNVYTNTRVNSYELMGSVRKHGFLLGGHLDFMAGVKYYEFDEWVRVEGKGNVAPTVAGAVQGSNGGLAQMTIDNDAINRIIGPQVGLRFFRTWGSITGSFEARAMAGVNAQAVKLRSAIGTDPASIVAFMKEGNDNAQLVEFTPVGELRFNFAYQATRAIAIRAGWTGMYAEGLARPSNMIHYTLPVAKIIKDNNTDDAFIQGVNVGVEINR